jgi:hypothetical protein
MNIKNTTENKTISKYANVHKEKEEESGATEMEDDTPPPLESASTLAMEEID